MSMRYDPFSRAAVDSYYESLRWAPEDAVIERSERSRKQENNSVSIQSCCRLGIHRH